MKEGEPVIVTSEQRSMYGKTGIITKIDKNFKRALIKFKRKEWRWYLFEYFKVNALFYNPDEEEKIKNLKRPE